MKIKSLFVLFFIVLVSSGCGKNSEEATSSSDAPMDLKQDSNFASVAGEISSSTRGVADEEEKSSSGKEDIIKKGKTENQLGKIFSPLAGNTERLLEYNIQLTYQCSDLIKTRKELLDLISKFGYLESSSAVNSRSPYMNVKIHVQSSRLHEALVELDKLGNLISEDLSSIDHTEGMVWQKRKMNRERIRLTRRNTASNQIAAAAKNWQSIENSVSGSEDALDQADQETWKINDKISWATISIGYTLPTPTDEIQIPEYKNAFVGILNGFLLLSYYLLWNLPFLILGIALYYYGRIVLVKMIRTIKR